MSRAHKDPSLQDAGENSPLPQKIAHDLRNPINVIVGYASLLLSQTELDSMQEEAVGKILKATQKLQELVSSFENVCPTPEEQPSLSSAPVESQNCEIKRLKVASPVNILIVDDEEDNRMVLSHLLKRAGVGVTHAHDGAQAVSKACSEDIDLIFMDLRLPDIRGEEASNRIHQKLPSLPIVALSADLFAMSEYEDSDHGFFRMLKKPYRSNEIFQVITEALGVSFIPKNESDVSFQPVFSEDERQNLLPLAQSGQITRLEEAIGNIQHPSTRKHMKNLLHHMKMTEISRLLKGTDCEIPASA